MAVAYSRGLLTVFDEQTHEELHRFRPHWRAFTVSWSPHDRWLATCGEDGFIKVWDVRTWSLKHTFSGHRGVVHRVAWSPDAASLASCGADGQVFVWPVREEHAVSTYRLTGRSDRESIAWHGNRHVQFLQDNSTIAELDLESGSIEGIRQVDAEKGNWQLIHTGLAACVGTDGALCGWTDSRLNDALVGEKFRQLAIHYSTDSVKLAYEPAKRC